MVVEYDKLFKDSKEYYALVAMALDQFDYYRELLGTEVTVMRSELKTYFEKKFGPNFSTRVVDSEEHIEYKYKLVIHLYDLMNLHLKIVDQIDVYDNSEKINVGDLLTFTGKTGEHKFKVEKKELLGEGEKVLVWYQMHRLM